MKKKIKETIPVYKWIGCYDKEQRKDTYYTEEEIEKTIGKINFEVNRYKQEYGVTPQLILISREIEILFRMKLDLMIERQMIYLFNQPIYLYSIFGIACMVTPALKDLEFEVR